MSERIYRTPAAGHTPGRNLGWQIPPLDSAISGGRTTALTASPGKTSPEPDEDELALALRNLRRIANTHSPRLGCGEAGCGQSAGLRSAHNTDVRAYRTVRDVLTSPVQRKKVA